jgi:hypothetical protein
MVGFICDISTSVMAKDIQWFWGPSDQTKCTRMVLTQKKAHQSEPFSAEIRFI